jgi:D-beta-D-heptose 7-phosphate kinase/D-beta-D-heptose 1-phosphate adenosyltransferase
MDKDIFNSFSKKKILIIGDYCIDEFLEGDANSVSPEAPILRALIRNISINPGMTGNIALGVRGLGAETYAAGIVGEDNTSRDLMNLLKETGVNTEGMIIQKNRITPKFSRVVLGGKKYPKQSAIRFDVENENDVSEESLGRLLEFLDLKKREISAIIVADYDEVGKGVIKRPFLDKIIEIANKNNIIIIGDSRKNFNNFHDFTCITPNIFEAELAYGKKIDSVFEMSKELIKRLNLKSILVKKDKDGMEITLFDGKRYSVPALAKNVVDVTGAGDSVICSFTLGLCSGLSPFEATKLASYSAAISVSKYGLAVVTTDELKHFAEENER